MKSSSTLICSECGGQLEERDGELVCVQCGLVSEEVLSFTNEFDPVFVPEKRIIGSPETMTLHDKGLLTNFDSCSGKNKKEFFRLNKLQKRVRSQVTERSLLVGLSKLQLFSDKLLLPNAIKERSAFIFRKARAKKLVRGRTIVGVLGASIYVACRQANILKTVREIAEVCDTDEKTIKRCLCLLFKEFNLSTKNSPIHFISVISTKAKMPGEQQGKASRMMMQLIADRKIAGKNPKVLAATVLYIVGRDFGFTQKELARVAGVTEVSIRNRYKEIEKYFLKKEKEGVKMEK